MKNNWQSSKHKVFVLYSYLYHDYKKNSIVVVKHAISFYLILVILHISLKKFMKSDLICRGVVHSCGLQGGLLFSINVNYFSYNVIDMVCGNQLL